MKKQKNQNYIIIIPGENGVTIYKAPTTEIQYRDIIINGQVIKTYYLGSVVEADKDQIDIKMSFGRVKNEPKKNNA